MDKDKFEKVLEGIYNEMKKVREDSNTNYDNLSKKLDNYANRVENLEKKIDGMEQQQCNFYDYFDDVKGEVNGIKQKELALNLIIKGVSERENETAEQLLSLVEQVMSSLQIGTTVGQFKLTKRIGRKINAKPRLILIETTSKEQKALIISAKRKHKVTANQILIDNNPMGKDDQNIYVDEHLTPYTARLLKRCRTMRSELNIKYVWTNNGIVYIRKDDNAQATVIRNDYDVDMFRAAQVNSGGLKRKIGSIVHEDDPDSITEMPAPKKPLTRSSSLNLGYITAREKFVSRTSPATTTNTGRGRGPRGRSGK